TASSNRSWGRFRRGGNGHLRGGLSSSIHLSPCEKGQSPRTSKCPHCPLPEAGLNRLYYGHSAAVCDFATATPCWPGSRLAWRMASRHLSNACRRTQWAGAQPSSSSCAQGILCPRNLDTCLHATRLSGHTLSEV